MTSEVRRKRPWWVGWLPTLAPRPAGRWHAHDRPEEQRRRRAGLWLHRQRRGEAPGGAKFIVTELTITTKDRIIESVIAPLRDVLNFRQTLDSLLERGEVFGWDTSGTQAIFDRAEQATRDGVPYEFTFGPADRVGVPTPPRRAATPPATASSSTP